MSGKFGNLTSDGLEETQDRLGGFSLWDTDIYTGTIKYAYAGASSGGAQFIGLSFESGGKEYREDIYITNKKGENFFINKDDKTKKVPLPGFVIIDDICLAVTGSPLSEQADEEKVIKLYDYDEKKEVPKTVDMLTGLVGQEVSLAIYKNLVNKQAKNATTGDYEDTDETRETNSIEKVFHTETKMTIAEARNGKETGEFWDGWLNRHKGKVRDNRKNKGGNAANSKASAAPVAGQKTQSKSLFAK